MLVFDPFLTRPAVGQVGFVPAVDIVVGENDLVLTLDVPGFTAEDLDIHLLDRDLVVRGERKFPELTEGTLWAHRERGFGSFERRIRLPDGVEPEAITANVENGVLSLIVAKPERLKPRTITIGGARQRELETTTA